MKMLRDAPFEHDVANELAPEAYVCLTDNVNYALLRPCDIISLEAVQNYTRVSTTHNERHLLVRRSLVKCEERLPSDLFCRVSRYFLINLRHVTAILPHDGRHLIFKMSDGTTVNASKNGTLAFRRAHGF